MGTDNSAEEYPMWRVEFFEKDGRAFFGSIEAVDQLKAKEQFERENPGAQVTLVTDFWDGRKKRMKF